MTAWWDLTTFNYTRSNNLMDNFNALLDGSKTFTNLRTTHLTVSGLATIASLTVSGLATIASLTVSGIATIANLTVTGGAFVNSFTVSNTSNLRLHLIAGTGDDPPISRTNILLYRVNQETVGVGFGMFGNDESYEIYNYTTAKQLLSITPAGNVGFGLINAGSKTEWALATANLEIVDAGSLGATEQGWITVQIGNLTGYLRVFAAK